ncbi:MAG TPA: hypothetical protein VL500_04095 [Candidatus Eisenbacteria bacterium]|nr:hypothetical protein [Candidatus Eisenbacteria bacterium]
MRKNVISLLFVVFALTLGACAGRQMHAGMPGTSSFQSAARQEPPRVSEEAAAPAADPTPAVETVAAAPLTDDELKAKVQLEIDTYVRHEIDASNASIRAAAEKMHQTHMPASPPDNDELVAALRIDAAAFRRLDAETTRTFYAMLDELLDRAVALERAQRRERAIARAERRHAVATTRAAAPPAEKPKPAAALAAGTEPVPSTMPQDAAVAASERMKTVQDPAPLAMFVPDASVAAQGRRTVSVYLTGALFAAVLGLLLALAIARRRSREFRRLMREDYKDVPDGTLLIREIRGGIVHRNFAVMAKPGLRKLPLDPADVETIERQWFDQVPTDAAAAANDETSSDPPPRPDPPTADDRPVPTLEPRIDPFEPPPARAPVPLPGLPPVRQARPPLLASGSAQISSQGRETTSVGGEIDATTKDDGPKDVDAPDRTIIYEEHPQDPPADRTAPSN